MKLRRERDGRIQLTELAARREQPPLSQLDEPRSAPFVRRHDEGILGRAQSTFLAGGGEQGERIREFDWTATPLGAEGGWPEALKTVVSIMLSSNQPMFVAWGASRTLIYNEAYADILRDKHPLALGRDLLEVWSEIREGLEPIVARTLHGEPVQMDDIAFVMNRHGRDEVAHFSFFYAPLRGAAGEVTGIFCACSETTQQVQAQARQEAERLQMRRMLAQMPGFVAMLSGPEHRFDYANAAYLELVGGRELLGKPVREALPEVEGQGYFELLDGVYATGEPFMARNSPVTLGGDQRFVDFLYHAIRAEDGTITGIFVGGYDVTERVRSEESLARSEAMANANAALLEQIIETAPEPIWTKDAAGRFQLVNSAAAAVMGRSREEVIGLRDEAFAPAELVETLKAEERRILQGGETIRVEETIPNFGAGRSMTFLSTKAPIRDAQGQVIGLVGMARDITERLQTEERLRATAERVQLALDAGAIAGTWVWDVATDCFTADELFARTFGLDAAACHLGVPLETVMGAIHPDDTEAVRTAVAKAVARGGPYRLQYRVRREEGGYRWIEANGRVELGADGTAVRFPGVLLDIDERRAAEEERDRAIRLLEIFSDAVPGVVYAKDLDGRMLVANRGTTELVGKPPAEYLGKTDLEFLDDKDQARQVMANDRRIMQTGEAEQLEEEVRLPTGAQAWWLSNKAPLRDPDGQIIGLIGASVDITGRKAAEAALAESRRQLEELNRTLEERVSAAAAELDRVWRNSRDLLVVVGADGIFRSISPSWKAVLGHEPQEVVGRSFLEFIWPADAPKTQEGLDAAAAAQDLTDFENRYQHKDGAFRWISWHTSVEGDVVYAYGRDVTAEKARQEELQLVQEALRQSQKLEGMGQLTGGVAHDFNNLLMPIIAALDMLQRRLDPDERTQRLLDGAIQSAERAKTLVQRLLAFARRQPLQARAVSVAKLCEGMVDLLASTSGPRVRIELDVDPALPNVKADPNQLEMALLNLAVNARDAMPDGGQITIAAHLKQVAERHRSRLRPGDYVRLAVSDTGVGMDEITQQRAIEPFFSTKGIGKGTGLGLSMVHGLAAQLGGALTIQSRVGVGTTIELWLPVAGAAAPKLEAQAPSDLPRMTGAALLVDDEELVRASTAEMLKDLGYTVAEASSAEEALRLLDGGLEADVLVTDHLMPGMSGADLVRRLREERPGVRALIVSGYAEDEGLAEDLPRLTKPYRQHELAEALASLFSRSGRAPDQLLSD